jgi:hypothetical protein
MAVILETSLGDITLDLYVDGKYKWLDFSTKFLNSRRRRSNRLSNRL